MLRRSGGAWALALALLLIASLSFAGPAFGASCAPRGSKTLVHRGGLRVYRVTHSVWVCTARYGHRIRLARNAAGVDLYRRPSLRSFAYAIAYSSVGAIFGSRDLKTGALLRGHVVDTRAFTSVTVDRFIAKPDGAIAFIYSWVGGNTHDAGDTVAKVDATGFQVLDSACVLCGDHIDTAYLSIVGNTVEWMDNSMIRSAPFQ